MSLRLIDPNFIPMKVAGLPLTSLDPKRDEIELTALGTAEVITHPMAIGHPHVSNGLKPVSVIEMRAFLAGHMATPVDLTLKAYRVPLDDNIPMENWDDVRADDPFYTKTIDYSTVGATPAAELVTGGAFTDALNDTGGATTAGSATISLDAATNLSAVVAGNRILLGGRLDGINGTGEFEIVSVNDAGDTVNVLPVPSVSGTGIAWWIGGLGWKVGNGWSHVITGGKAVYDPGLYNGRAGKLEQPVSMTTAKKYLLTFGHGETPSDSGAPDGLSASIGTQVVRRADRVGANNTFFVREAAAGADNLVFRMNPVSKLSAVEIDNVTLNEVIPFYFSDVRAFDEPADKGAGSGIAYGFLPTADMALTFLSVWYRRWYGSY